MPHSTDPEADPDPRLLTLARPVRPVLPHSRIAEAIETLRMSAYRAVPVVDGVTSDGSAGELIGWLSEADLTHAFLERGSSERAALREMPVQLLMRTPPEPLLPGQFASEAAARLNAAAEDALPVVDYQGRFLGMVAHSDLVRELTRPHQPPSIGGMATPIGVYLTTGSVTGGVGFWALFLTGLAMFGAYLASVLLTEPLTDWVRYLPPRFQPTVLLLAQSVFQLGFFLGFVRFSPMAGYHAAEHQVVHAIERGEPLLVPTVREMPRVHPRCGTNIVAGGTIFWTLGAALEPFLGEWSYLISGLLAFTYWRPFGSWLQQYMTTRPASDAELESGITAAKTLLKRHTPVSAYEARPHTRLWHMGFLQILSGFGVGFGVAYLLTRLFPGSLGGLAAALQSVW
ncbi:MAG: hypothetical protein OHK0029_16850 [Armatimonadaceae bacterium]